MISKIYLKSNFQNYKSTQGFKAEKVPDLI